jgi:hypothetical protein
VGLKKQVGGHGLDSCVSGQADIRWAFVNSEMKLRIPYNAENFVIEENVPFEGGL